MSSTIKKSLEEIAAKFKASLEMPSHTPSRQFFFCPVGLVGAGKTTVTKPLSRRLGLLRFSSDELRKLLKENGHTYDRVKEIGLKLVDEYARKGFSISFDMDCGNPEVKKFVEVLADELHVSVIWVHIDTPEEYIFDKFRKHPPSWLADNPQTMIDNYRAQKERRLQEDTQFDYFYTFDTSRPDIEAQIDECGAKIEGFLRIC
jgi:predicted kinase